MNTENERHDPHDLNDFNDLNHRVQPSEQIHALNHFLKQHDQGRAGRGDLNIISRHGTRIIGCARFLPVENEPDVLWLRGVFVMESERHRGVATALLNFARETLLKDRPDTRCYAFAQPHLEGFYRALGYCFCTPEALPQALNVRFQQAQSNGKQWLCLVLEVAAGAATQSD
jgi:predicted GNAT family N-acyltransferase